MGEGGSGGGAADLIGANTKQRSQAGKKKTT